MYEKYPEQAGDIEPQTSPLNVTGATNFQLSVKQFILGLVQLAHPSWGMAPVETSHQGGKRGLEQPNGWIFFQASVNGDVNL